ncbi:MAG: complex I NDUFA9 subunit family protein [bacterium]
MRIAVTGASGFVGGHLIRLLIREGHEIHAIQHRKDLPAALKGLANVYGFSGNVAEGASLLEGFAGCDAVIHLVGIIREFPRKKITFKRLHVEATGQVLAAMKKAGVRRLLHMSALGARPGAVSLYHQSKWVAEEQVRQSELDWTIFRPSLIYGPGDGFVSTMVPLAKAPFFPVIGGGGTHAEPVDIRDVTAVFAASLTHPETIGQTINVVGPERFTYREIYRSIAFALGRPFRPIAIPIPLVRPMVKWLEYEDWFPLTTTQLQMLQEDNVGDETLMLPLLDRPRIHLAEGLQYLQPKPAGQLKPR